MRTMTPTTRHFFRRLSLLGLLSATVLALAGCPKGGSNKSGDVDPNDPEPPYREGRAIIDEGREAGKIDYKKAFERFDNSCRIGWEVGDPHARACYNAGVAASHLGRKEQAASLFQKARQAEPGFKEAVQNLAVALLAAGKAADALPLFDEYFQANPKDVAMLNNYAGILGEAGRYDEGVEVVQRILFAEPKNTDAYKTLARIYFLQGNFRMSQMASANALKLDKDDADIHNNIGLTFLQEDKEAEAVIAFKEALKLDEDNIEANMNLGLIAVKSADYQLAAKLFQAVLKQQPGQDEARIGMGVAYRGILEMDSAIEQYDRILANSKCNTTALLNKGIVLHLFEKKYKEARKTYETIEKCDPGSTLAASWVNRVGEDIAEEERVEAELAEMERQMAELEAKAKTKRVALENEVVRAQKVFEKYKEVKQDPSWAEQLLIQLDATAFAIESEDYFFMEEQGQYLDEFMSSYYEYALVDEEGKPIADLEEWMGRSEIVLPEPEAPEGAEGAEGAEDGEAATEGTEGAEGATAEGADEGATEGAESATEGAESPGGEATETESAASAGDSGNPEAQAESNPE